MLWDTMDLKIVVECNLFLTLTINIINKVDIELLQIEMIQVFFSESTFNSKYPKILSVPLLLQIHSVIAKFDNE